MDDLLYGALDIPEIDRTRALMEVKSFKLLRYWFWDPFRASTMLPIMTINGQPEGVSHYSESAHGGNFCWTEYAPPTIKQYCEEHIFPITGPTRVMVLATKPGAANNEHIDCDPDTFNQRQHKLRFVLQGRTDSLYFMTKQGNIHIPNTNKPFIMDGAWPHGMINNFDMVKYTVAFGAPWQGNDAYENLVDIMHKSQYTMIDNYHDYFDHNKLA